MCSIEFSGTYGLVNIYQGTEYLKMTNAFQQYSNVYKVTVLLSHHQITQIAQDLNSSFLDQHLCFAPVGQRSINTPVLW